MTVSTTIAKSGPYAGAGTVGPFTVGFRFLQNDHLRVVRTDLDGVDTVLALTTDYSVSGAGNETGSVTLTVALAVGWKLTILRSVPATQEADYVQNDAFPAQSHERALDKLTMIVQQQQETLGRTLRAPESDSAPSLFIPSVEERAGRYLSFSDLGVPVATTFDVDAIIDASEAAISSAAAAAVSESNAAASASSALSSANIAAEQATLVSDQIAAVTPTVTRFSGDAVESEFTLPVFPGSENNTQVHIDGVYQQKDTYSVTDNVLIFSSAPPVGTDNIEVVISPSVMLSVGSSQDITFVQQGSGAITMPMLNKGRQILDSGDFVTLSQGISQAVTDGVALNMRQSLTVSIPSQCPDLQTALNTLYPVSKYTKITLQLESGYEIPSAIRVDNGDFSQFEITSVDAIVHLSALFPRSNILTCYNAKGPIFNILIDAQAIGNSGIVLDAGSSILVRPGKGVMYAYGTGFNAINGSNACIRGSNFTYAAQAGGQSAGISSWSSTVDAEGADASNSLYYGAQAAHGGTLGFRLGKANDCGLLGIRATDRASVDFDLGEAQRCVRYNVYAFQNSNINAPGALVSDAVETNIAIVNGSTFNGRSAIATGAGEVGILVNGSLVDLYGIDLSGAGQYGAKISGGSSANLIGAITSNAGIRGLYVDGGANVNFYNATSDNCPTGIYADQGCIINGSLAKVRGCGTGVVAQSGSRVNLQQGDITGSTTYGVRALNGAHINVGSANCQNGGAPSSNDIMCFSGSIINASSSTGGLNRTANTMSSQGIIFKP